MIEKLCNIDEIGRIYTVKNAQLERLGEQIYKE